MLVSIIIPCYNVEQYISECIHSVLNQTYKTIEIIAVDNNSTDKTLEILRELQAKYPTIIKVIQEKQKGAPAARNAGFAASKGDFVCFLDGDDIITKEKIAHQVDYLLLKEADVVVSDRAFYDITLTKELRSLTFEKIIESPLNIAIRDIITVCNPIYTRKVITELGAYTIGLPNSQDWEFNLRVVLKRYKIVYTKGMFCICRSVPNSVSSNWAKVSFTVCKLLVKFHADIMNYGEELQTETLNTIFQYFFNSAIFASSSTERANYLKDMRLYIKNPENYLQGWKRVFSKIFGIQTYITLASLAKRV